MWEGREKSAAQDIKSAIKRSLIELTNDFGSVLPIEQIVRYNLEFTEEDVRKVVEELKGEGIVNEVDKDTIEVTYTT
jgi:hypothetical protein